MQQAIPKIIGAVLASACVFAGSACAHGFGPRYDLPVPLWLYLTGAAAAVAVSFVVMALFVRGGLRIADYPRIDLMRSRIGRTIAHPWLLAFFRAAVMAVFILVVIAGFFGHQSPVKNIAPLMVWAIWWVGMAYVSALLGDLWALVNPLNTAFAWAEKIYFRLRSGAVLARGLRYPPALAVWPAVVFFFAFAWSELIWERSDVPANVAAAMLLYCAITWTGMFLFGREMWLRHGEVFALIFSLLARFAPTEVCKSEAHREWNLRPYAVGLLVEAPLHPSMMVLIILMLATVTFDGLIETPLWVEIADDLGLRISTLPFTLTADGMRTAVYTLGLAGTALLFLSVYLACALLIARFADTSPAAGVAQRERHGALRTACLFVCTLIPIAIAYHLAHYLSFLMMAFQYLIPLASDPLGLGWDLFGTTNYFVRAGVIDARFVWYASVIAIVIGHIAAVCLAHAMALREFSTKQAALRSQYPMLALMIGYTMVSLWIIAQPIVSSRPG